jgi:hypothetical protein
MVNKTPLTTEEWQELATEAGYDVTEEIIKPLSKSDQAKIVKQSGYPVLSEIVILNDKMQNAINVIRAWAEKQRTSQSKESILLSSPPTQTSTGFGVGKTTLANAAAFIAYGHITNGGDLTLSRAGLTGKFYTEQTAMKSVREEAYPKRGIVIIDDVGRGGSIEFISKEDQIVEKQHRYFLLIDHCYRHNIPMILTTNLNKIQFIDCIGHAAWSRIAEMIGPNRIINLSGLPDYREILGGW